MNQKQYSRGTLRFVIGIVAIVGAGGAAGAHAAQPTSQPVPGVTVTAVESEYKDHPQAAAQSDAVLVTVDHLATLRQAAADAQKSIVLFFNGVPLKGVVAKQWLPASDGESGKIYFLLRDRDDSPDGRKLWAEFVRRPSMAYPDDRPVDVSLGLENRVPQPVNSNVVFKLRVISGGAFAASLIAFALLVIVFLMFAFRLQSNLLRDSGIQTVPGRPKPFSLGRSQMAFWFFLVLAAYLLLWIITGNYNTPTTGVLALIGISAATTVSAALIDSSNAAAAATATTPAPPGQMTAAQIQQAMTDLADLDKKFAQRTSELKIAEAALWSAETAQKALDPVSPQPPAATQKVAEAKTARDAAKKALDDVQTPRKVLEDQLASNGCQLESRGFFHDILSDESGLAFHRFQMVAWTVVLGIIFVATVYRDVTMPDFDASLLGLMGISSGTYIGFKFK